MMDSSDEYGIGFLVQWENYRKIFVTMEKDELNAKDDEESTRNMGR